jgi:hypothetical protein
MRFLKLFAWFMLFAGVIGATGTLLLLDHFGMPPRSLGPYLERRASGHNPFIVETGVLLNRTLTRLDRGDPPFYAVDGLRIGAQSITPTQPASHGGSIRLVSSSTEAVEAIGHARPGDVISFMPGSYRFQRSIAARHAGTDQLRITVRAEHLGTVFLEFEMTEGFVVSAPYWTFENLNIRGVCRSHSDCEHAFHVVGKGSHFTARNNRIEDFNAHFKINGTGDGFPDHGLIEQNTLSNRSVRQTLNPVTLIDLVAASHWTIRGNLISDFSKGDSDKISYGVFAKGGGSNNLLEQNIVLCEHRLQGLHGQRVGMSLGGGGTGKPYCRDRRCITEQDGSVIRSNLIAFCSDDGIYINRAATSKVLHNTLIDTGGIVVRFAESTADVNGNLVDGAIRTRDGGVVRDLDNLESGTARLYFGSHPVRDLYADSATLDFKWRSGPPRRAAQQSLQTDLCGTPRPPRSAYGAFEDFAACLKKPYGNEKRVAGRE